MGTSVSVVFLNALSGSLAYLAQRRVDLSLGWKFAVATVPGAIGGAFLTRGLSSHLFSLVFGLALIAIATLLVFERTAEPSPKAAVRRIIDARGESHVYRVDAWKGIVLSFFVGVFSSALGIGGGIIHVPFLIVVLGLPVHVATATSHFVLSISTLIGTITFLLLGHVQLLTAALLGAGALVGAQLGARASVRASPRLIARILAGALTLVGLRMVLEAARLLGW